jgi:hypothetical protein
MRRIRSLTRSLTTARRVPKNPPRGVDCRRSGYALPSARPRRILILIDAALSS